MAVLAALLKSCLAEDLSKTGKDFRNSLQQEGLMSNAQSSISST